MACRVHKIVQTGVMESPHAVTDKPGIGGWESWAVAKGSPDRPWYTLEINAFVEIHIKILMLETDASSDKLVHLNY
jgi:hypothetical protein